MDSKISYKSAKVWRGRKGVYNKEGRKFTKYIGATVMSANATCV
jgi:hypothetical protein